MATHEPTTKPAMTLGPEDEGRLVTADEFCSAEFLEPWTYEREGGRLVVMSPDGQRHIEGAQPWCQLLFDYRSQHRDVVEFVVPSAWVRVDDGTDRIGDIGVYIKRGGTVASIPDRVPDLMFEVASPGRISRDRDYLTKREEYHRLGIREYVIIDPAKMQVTVLQRTEGSYEERILRSGDAYTSALLPGLEIPLADVFA